VREHVEDAASLLRALDAAPAVVIGRSYGGEIAVDLVQRHPDLVRALVLLEPSMPDASPQMRAWVDELTGQARAAAAGDGPAAAAHVVFRAVFGDPTWDGLPAEVRQVFADNGPALLAELAGEWCTPDPALLGQVTQPVLIVGGQDSPPAFRAADEALARLLPGSRFELVSGGHLINPAAPAVLDFLREVLGPPNSSPADR
jgi:pimeloyl-ACP methyl ester carboxylesterase